MPSIERFAFTSAFILALSGLPPLPLILNRPLNLFNHLNSKGQRLFVNHIALEECQLAAQTLPFGLLLVAQHAPDRVCAANARLCLKPLSIFAESDAKLRAGCARRHRERNEHPVNLPFAFCWAQRDIEVSLIRAKPETRALFLFALDFAFDAPTEP